MGVHSSLGASSAERWMNCPGSVPVTADIPDTTSEYAHEGTCAHYLGERCLNEGVTPDNYLNEVLTLPEGDRSEGMPDEFTVTKEMVQNVAVYVDFCNALGGEMMVEQRLDYSKWVPNGFGTGDCLNFNEETGILDVTDLKYGQGVRVYAEDEDGEPNKQLMLYGLGAYDLMVLFGETVKKIRLNVIQPRLDNISTVEVTPKQLLDFGDRAAEEARLVEIVKEKYEQAEDISDEDFIASHPSFFRASAKACQWCKLIRTGGKCPENDRFIKDEALQGFDFLSEDELDADEHAATVPLSRLELIIKNEPMVTSMLKQVRERAEEMILAGEHVQGLKLVKGRGSKRYVTKDEDGNVIPWDDDGVIASLKALKGLGAKNAVTVKPLTPAVAYKHNGISDQWKKKHIEFVDGKPTVALESDKRKAVDVYGEAVEGFESED